MKILKLIFVVFFLIFVMGTNSFAQIPPQIINGLKSGDGKAVSGFFNENIELVVLDKESVSSQAQGEQILKDFFSKYIATDFKITHQGGDGSPFAIGKMFTSGGCFRVYIVLKTINNNPKVVQLRIEKDQDQP